MRFENLNYRYVQSSSDLFIVDGMIRLLMVYISQRYINAECSH